MKKFIWMFVFALPLVMATGAVCGEFYQYTDPQGNLVFTDDITTVPEDQRSGMQTYEAVRPAPTETPETPEALDVPDDTGLEPPDMTVEADEDMGVDVSGTPFGPDASELPEAEPVQEDHLDREKNRLDALHDELMEERKRLSEMPVDQMNNTQRNVHRDRVNRLNTRLREFDRQVDRFQQSVREYNIRIQEESRRRTIPDVAENI
jgi:hypothetical protein